MRGRIPKKSIQEALRQEYGTHFISSVLHELDTNEGVRSSVLMAPKIGALLDGPSILASMLKLFKNVMNSVKGGLLLIDWKNLVSGPPSDVIYNLLGILQQIIDTSINFTSDVSSLAKILSKRFFEVIQSFFDYVKQLLVCSTADSIEKNYIELSESSEVNQSPVAGLEVLFDSIRKSFGPIDPTGNTDQESKCSAQTSAESAPKNFTWQDVSKQNKEQDPELRLTPRQISSIQRAEGELNNASRLMSGMVTAGNALWSLVVKSARVLLPVIKSLYEKCLSAVDNVGELISAFVNAHRGSVSASLVEPKKKLYGLLLRIISGFNIFNEILSNAGTLVDKALDNIRNSVVDSLIWLIDHLSGWSSEFSVGNSDLLRHLQSTNIWKWIASTGKTTFTFFMFLAITVFRWTIGFITRIRDAVVGFSTKLIIKSANSLVVFFAGGRPSPYLPPGGEWSLIADVKTMLATTETCKDLIMSKPENFSSETRTSISELFELSQKVQQSSEKLSTLRMNALLKPDKKKGSLSQAFSASAKACETLADVWTSSKEDSRDFALQPRGYDPWSFVSEQSLSDICDQYYGKTYMALVESNKKDTIDLSDGLSRVLPTFRKELLTNSKKLASKIQTEMKISAMEDDPSQTESDNEDDSMKSQPMDTLDFTDTMEIMNMDPEQQVRFVVLSYGNKATPEKLRMFLELAQQNNKANSSKRPPRSKSYRKYYLVVMLLSIALGAIFAYWYFSPEGNQLIEEYRPSCEEALEETKKKFFSTGTDDLKTLGFKEVVKIYNSSRDPQYRIPDGPTSTIEDLEVQLEYGINQVKLMSNTVKLEKANEIHVLGTNPDPTEIDNVFERVYEIDYENSSGLWKFVTSLGDPFKSKKLQMFRDTIKSGKSEPGQGIIYDVSKNLDFAPMAQALYNSIASDPRYDSVDSRLKEYETQMREVFQDFKTYYQESLESIERKRETQPKRSPQGYPAQFTAYSKTEIERIGALVFELFPGLRGDFTFDRMISALISEGSFWVVGGGIFFFLFLIIPVLGYGIWGVIKQRRADRKISQYMQKDILLLEATKKTAKNSSLIKSLIGDDMKDDTDDHDDDDKTNPTDDDDFLQSTLSLLSDDDVVEGASTFFWSLINILSVPPTLGGKFMFSLIRAFFSKGGFLWSAFTSYSLIYLSCDVGRIYKTAFYLPQLVNINQEFLPVQAVSSEYEPICRSCKLSTRPVCSAGSLCANDGQTCPENMITCPKCAIPTYCDQRCLNYHWKIHKKCHNSLKHCHQ